METKVDWKISAKTDSDTLLTRIIIEYKVFKSNLFMNSEYSQFSVFPDESGEITVVMKNFDETKFKCNLRHRIPVRRGGETKMEGTYTIPN